MGDCQTKISGLLQDPNIVSPDLKAAMVPLYHNSPWDIPSQLIRAEHSNEVLIIRYMLINMTEE